MMTCIISTKKEKEREKEEIIFLVHHIPEHASMVIQRGISRTKKIKKNRCAFTICLNFFWLCHEDIVSVCKIVGSSMSLKYEKKLVTPKNCVESYESRAGIKFRLLHLRK